MKETTATLLFYQILLSKCHAMTFYNINKEYKTLLFQTAYKLKSNENKVLKLPIL